MNSQGTKDYQPSASEARLQSALKIAIAVMTLLMVVGLGAIAYRILSPENAAGPAGLPLAEQTLTLPDGAAVNHLAFSGKTLAVHFVAPSGSGIALIDTTSGRRLSLIRIAPEPTVP